MKECNLGADLVMNSFLPIPKPDVSLGAHCLRKALLLLQISAYVGTPVSPEAFDRKLHKDNSCGTRR
jgi:hypothetical protein